MTGRSCVVTGAAGGIGRAIVAALRAEGATVTGVDIEIDLASRDGPRAVAQMHPDTDILVNCAGIGLAGPFAEAEEVMLRRLIAVNLTAPIVLTRLLLPRMLEQGSGHIVNVSSLVGHVPKRLESVYAGSKAGLDGFTRSLHEELRDSGVGVSLVSPAVVDTGFFEARGAPYARRWPRKVPPERVAKAVVGAIRHNRVEVLVPRWYGVPVRLHGAMPGLYRGLARRFD